MDSSFKSGGIRVVSGLSLPTATSSSVQAPLSSSRASVFGPASGGTSARGSAVSTSASMVLSNMDGSMFSKPIARAGSPRSTMNGGQGGPSSVGKPGQAAASSSLPFSDVDDILSSLSTEDQEGLGWARAASRRALEIGTTDSERARARRDADARPPAQYSSVTPAKPAEVEFWVPNPEKPVSGALSAVPLPLASPATPAPPHSQPSRNAVTIKRVTSDRAALAGSHVEGFSASASPLAPSSPTVFVVSHVTTLAALMKAAESRRVVAKHFPTGAAPPSVVPGSPRSARPRTQAARAADSLSVPGVVLDACRHLLADSKSRPAGSEFASMPIFKDIDDLLSTPSPTLSQPVMHPCRHAHGPAPAGSESCSEGPVVQLLDGLLACLEWRALRAAAPVLDIVAGMDAGRRKWNLAAVAKVRTAIEAAAATFDAAVSSSPSDNTALLGQLLIQCVEHTVLRSRHFLRNHSQHAIFLHARSPLLSVLTRAVLMSAWVGDAIGTTGATGGLPPGIADALLQVWFGSASSSDAPDAATRSPRPSHAAVATPASPVLHVLDHGCKLLLMHSELLAAVRPSASARTGPKMPGQAERWSITVSRGTAWPDMQSALRSIGIKFVSSTVPQGPPLGGASHSASARLVNPSFAATFKGGREEGEGHGPRKELFHVLGQQATASFTDWVAGCGEVHGSDGRNALSGQFLGWAVPGARIREPSGKWTFDIVSCEPSTGSVRISQPLPYDISHDSFEYSLPLKPLLAYKASAEGSWITEDSAALSGRLPADTVEKYACLGWIFASAIINRAQLGLTPARLLMAQVWPASQPQLGGSFTPTEFDVLLHDSALYQSLRNVRNMDAKSLRTMLAAEDLDKSTSAADYCVHMMRSVLVEPYEIQVAWIRHGFAHALGPAGLDVLRRYDVTCDDLSSLLFLTPTMVTGSLSIRSLFRVRYDDELSHTPELQDALWAVIDEWDTATKRKFLKFVTGVDTLPAPGMEVLNIEIPFVHFSIEEHKKAVQMLPQSHTCSNTLEIPNYFKSMMELTAVARMPPPTVETCTQLLRLKLTQAVLNTAGYALDTMSSEGHTVGTSVGPSQFGKSAARSAGASAAKEDSDSDDPPSPTPPPRIESRKHSTAPVILLASFDVESKDTDSKTARDIPSARTRAAEEKPGGYSSSVVHVPAPAKALPSDAIQIESYRAPEAQHSRASRWEAQPVKAVHSGLSDSLESRTSPTTATGSTPSVVKPATVSRTPISQPVQPSPTVDGFDWEEVEELDLL